MTDTDIILHDHDTGHIITDCDGVCPPAPAPVCGAKYTADGGSGGVGAGQSQRYGSDDVTVCCRTAAPIPVQCQ